MAHTRGAEPRGEMGHLHAAELIRAKAKVGVGIEFRVRDKVAARLRLRLRLRPRCFVVSGRYKGEAEE